MPSLHAFCRDTNLAKTSVKRWLNEQGFDTSKGLSEEAVEAAIAHFLPDFHVQQPPVESQGNQSPSPGGQLAKMPIHSTELLPQNGHGKRFEMGSPYAIHFHIHTSNKADYQQSEALTDQNVQALLGLAQSTRFEQGQEDQAEVDAIIAAAKSKLIEAGIAGLVMGKQPDGESSPPPPPSSSQSPE